MKDKRWCITLADDGWSFWLHPYRGTQDDDSSVTDIFASFGEAKKECLALYRNHLSEIRNFMRAVKSMRRQKK